MLLLLYSTRWSLHIHLALSHLHFRFALLHLALRLPGHLYAGTQPDQAARSTLRVVGLALWFCRVHFLTCGKGLGRDWGPERARDHAVTYALLGGLKASTVGLAAAGMQGAGCRPRSTTCLPPPPTHTHSCRTRLQLRKGRNSAIPQFRAPDNPTTPPPREATPKHTHQNQQTRGPAPRSSSGKNTLLARARGWSPVRHLHPDAGCTSQQTRASSSGLKTTRSSPR